MTVTDYPATESLRDAAAAQAPAERTLPGRRARVTMVDGATFDVRITNRDYVAWDKTAPRKKWGKAEDVPFLAQTFLAWSAARRDGQTELGFDAFADAADDVESLEADDEDTARPTRTGPAPV